MNSLSLDLHDYSKINNLNMDNLNMDNLNMDNLNIINSISFLFISWIGLVGLYRPFINFQLQILYSSLILNGITACLYQLTGYIGFGLLDKASMIMIALSSVYLFSLHLDKLIKMEQIPLLRTQIIIKVIYLLVASYFIGLMTAMGLNQQLVVDILFGLFLASLWGYMKLVHKHSGKLHVPYQIINFGWTGIKYIFISGILWILASTLMSQWVYINYLFVPIWWHFFVSYGGYLISLVPNYMILFQETTYILVCFDRWGIPYLKY
jgi:hypothetical protein